MKLKSLQKLILDGNNLTSLPDSIGELSLLEELSLINNGLAFLASRSMFIKKPDKKIAKIHRKP